MFDHLVNDVLRAEEAEKSRVGGGNGNRPADRPLVTSAARILLHMQEASWDPTTEDELLQAANALVLEESHHLELKRQLNAGKEANLELARDLAALAVDGGLLIFGMDEGSPPQLHPVPLAGIPERIEQVALTRIDEPLALRVTSIPSTRDPSIGYLVVRVPQSSLAPHMVDGRYFGRGDKTKHVLSDDEVVRLHLRRERWRDSAVDLLNAYVRRDPMPDGLLAHLFIVGEPVAGTEGMLLPIVEDGADPWNTSLDHLIHTRALGVRSSRPFSPELDDARAAVRRGDGWALTSHHLRADRQTESAIDEKYLIELELSEGGAIRLFCGRGSDVTSEGTRVTFEGLVTGLCHDVLMIAMAISEVAGHWGGWDFGVAVTNARGISSYSFKRNWSAAPAPNFQDEEYRQTTRASLEELTSRPNTVVDRLAGRFVRALGVRKTEEMKQLLD